MPDHHILVVGVGRSGTNWLFDLLNLSPLTRCRNATHNAVPDSLLAPLIRGVAPLPREADLGLRWDAAIRAMAHGMGPLDGPIPVIKDHLSPLAQRFGFVRALGSRRTRSAMSVFVPAFRQQEWPVPGWVASSASLDRAIPVLRTGESLACLGWVLDERPDARLLHMVRHPGGFANSWQSRFLSERDAERVRSTNLDRLREVVRCAPDWSDRLGDIDVMTAEEAELWFWLYATETAWQIGREHDGYALVTFESLAANLLETLRRVYAHCDLPLTDAVAQAAERMPSRFSGKTVSAAEVANAWRSKLSPEHTVLVDRILADSPVRSFWE